MSRLLVGMSSWVAFEPRLALNCAVIENSMVNALKADPQLINPIAQKVGLGPPQFVTHFAQPLQSQEALVLDLGGQSAEPFQELARSVLFREWPPRPSN